MTFLAIRYLLGSIVYAGAQFVIVSLLNKFGSTEHIGQYALGLAITAPIFMLSHLHLRSVWIVNSSGKHTFGSYIGLRWLTSAAAFSITVGIALLGGFDRNTSLVIVLISTYRFIESISDLLLGVCQKQEQLDSITFSRISKGIISTISFILVYIPTQSLILSLLTMIIGWFCIMLGYDFRKARQLVATRPVFAYKQLKPLVRASAPLGIVLALMSLNANIPHYSIAYFRGQHDLGVYASLAYMIVACNVVVTALGEAYTPRLAKWFTEGRYSLFVRLLVRMITMGVLLGGLGCIGGWAFGTELLTLLYNRELAAEMEVFLWMLLSTLLIFVSSFLWYGITATRTFSLQIPLFLCTAGSNAAACLLLVPRYGLVGAAAGTMVSLLVQTGGSVLLLIYAMNKEKRRVNGEAAAA
ncbi:MAG: hypothetical protein K0R67_6 [Paenibacillus sp.]|jgi:O-antigen/teichoic acid export membrane protein|nr:hypothetical protein [Paenibacillus sp.]